MVMLKYFSSAKINRDYELLNKLYSSLDLNPYEFSEILFHM